MLLGAVAGIGLLLGSVYLYRTRAKARAVGEHVLEEGGRKAGGGYDAPLTVDDVLKASKSATSKADTSPRPQLAPIPLSDGGSSRNRRRSCMAHSDDESAVSRGKPDSVRRANSHSNLALNNAANLPTLPPPTLVSANWRPPPRRKNLEAFGIFEDANHAEATAQRHSKMRHNSVMCRSSSDPRKRSCMMVRMPR